VRGRARRRLHDLLRAVSLGGQDGRESDSAIADRGWEIHSHLLPTDPPAGRLIIERLHDACWVLLI
jgi:hypothetical protein